MPESYLTFGQGLILLTLNISLATASPTTNYFVNAVLIFNVFFSYVNFSVRLKYVLKVSYSTTTVMLKKEGIMISNHQ